MYKKESKLSWEELQERNDVFFFKEGTFVKTFNDTIRYVLNKTDLQAVGLYYILLAHYNVNNKTCFPSLETLSTECGVSVNTIISVLKRLEDAEVIKIKKGKQGKCNQYSFPLEEQRTNKPKKQNAPPYKYLSLPRHSSYDSFLEDDPDF